MHINKYSITYFFLSVIFHYNRYNNTNNNNAYNILRIINVAVHRKSDQQ